MKALRWFGIILVGLVAIGMVMQALGIERDSPTVSVPIVGTCAEARANQALIPNPNGSWMFLWAYEVGRKYEIPLWWAERQKVHFQRISSQDVNTAKPCDGVMYRVN